MDAKNAIRVAATLLVMRAAPAADDLPVTTLIYAIGGAAGGERFGCAVAGAGDVDGDGTNDFVIGARRADPFGAGLGRAIVVSGATGMPLHEWWGDSPGDSLGTSVSGAGDVNGDGFADVALGAPLGDPAAGSVTIRSGFDGTTLFLLAGGAPGDEFGRALAEAGDVDGDGFVDLAIGSPHADVNGKSSGRVTVHSGRTGGLLLSIDGNAAFDQLGFAVSGAGDTDADGVPDLVIGAPFADVAAFNGGAAAILSGQTSSVLLTIGGTGIADQLGFSVGGAGDVDQDGRADVVVGIPAADVNGIDSGRAEVRSGATGAVLLAIDGAKSGDGLGFVAGIDDADGDGVPDVVVGAPSVDHGAAEAGLVRVVSGASGVPLLELFGPAQNDWFGVSVRGAGDVDGDGAPDLLIGAPGHDDDLTKPGFVRLASSRPRPLSASGHVVSLSAGGAVSFRLDAGPSYAGTIGFLLGSISGTSPGIPAGPFVLPLVPDSYFLYTASHPNATPTLDSLGPLDALGCRTATFALPTGQPAIWTGLTIHHAFLVALADDGSPLLASNACPITLVP